MVRDTRDGSSQGPVPRQALLMRALVELIQAAARQLDPLVFQEMVRGVGAQLGRQALSEYRLTRHAGGRLGGYTWAECLKEIAEQFGWTLRVAIESEGVIRVIVLGCECAKSDESASDLCEFGSALFGGAMAEAVGDVKACVSRCSETPPLNCTFAIHYRTSKESLAASGVIYPRISDRTVRRAEEPLGSRPDVRLTPREAQILQAIARGLPDKEIAKDFQLSVRTVENHAARIRKKLHVGNRAALVRFVLAPRLTEP